MEKEAVVKVIEYFNIFAYPPSLEQIHKFLTSKIEKGTLLNILEHLIKDKKIATKAFLLNKFKKKQFIYRFSLYNSRNNLNNFLKRQRIFFNKLKKTSFCIKVISCLPLVKLVGLSGSLSMEVAQEEDDVDIFIISKAGYMWTARLFVLIVAELFGMRRRFNDKNPADKLCFNLFFCESNLSVPNSKRNFYTAHEVLQMRPLYQENNIYEEFIIANGWVKHYFPNVNIPNRSQARPIVKNMSLIERLSKFIQLYFIKKHLTKEIITDSQLWFFPKDFQDELDFARYI